MFVVAFACACAFCVLRLCDSNDSVRTVTTLSVGHLSLCDSAARLCHESVTYTGVPA